MNAGNKTTASMHHPQRRNVTTSIVGLKKSHIRKNLTQNGEPQRYSLECRPRRRRTTSNLTTYPTRPTGCRKRSALAEAWAGSPPQCLWAAPGRRSPAAAWGGPGSARPPAPPRPASAAHPPLCTAPTPALPVHMEVTVHWFYLWSHVQHQQHTHHRIQLPHLHSLYTWRLQFTDFTCGAMSSISSTPTTAYSSHTCTPCTHGGKSSLILPVEPCPAPAAHPPPCKAPTPALPVHMEVTVHWFYLQSHIQHQQHNHQRIQLPHLHSLYTWRLGFTDFTCRATSSISSTPTIMYSSHTCTPCTQGG